MAGVSKLLRMRLWERFRERNGRSDEALTHEAPGKFPKDDRR